MGTISDRRTVATHVIFGRTFEVERIAWRNSDGLSFDVNDTETGTCITNESFDAQPDAEDIADLLRSLRDDRDAGILDRDNADDLTAILDAVPDDEQTNETVICEGCRSTVDADLWVDHVRNCDHVDGAGHAIN